jgi:hypothetical protein
MSPLLLLSHLVIVGPTPPPLVSHPLLVQVLLLLWLAYMAPIAALAGEYLGAPEHYRLPAWAKRLWPEDEAQSALILASIAETNARERQRSEATHRAVEAMLLEHSQRETREGNSAAT